MRKRVVPIDGGCIQFLKFAGKGRFKEQLTARVAVCGCKSNINKVSNTRKHALHISLQFIPNRCHCRKGQGPRRGRHRHVYCGFVWRLPILQPATLHWYPPRVHGQSPEADHSAQGACKKAAQTGRGGPSLSCHAPPQSPWPGHDPQSVSFSETKALVRHRRRPQRAGQMYLQTWQVTVHKTRQKAVHASSKMDGFHHHVVSSARRPLVGKAVCVGARAAGGRAQSALGLVPCAGRGGGGRRVTPWVGAWPSCSTHGWPWGPGGGGGGIQGRGTPLSFSSGPVVGACGGLCVPGAPGPSSGAWVQRMHRPKWMDFTIMSSVRHADPWWAYQSSARHNSKAPFWEDLGFDSQLWHCLGIPPTHRQGIRPQGQTRRLAQKTESDLAFAVRNHSLSELLD